MPQKDRARMAVNIDPAVAEEFKERAALYGLSVNQSLKLAVYQSLGKGPSSEILVDYDKLRLWLRGK